MCRLPYLYTDSTLPWLYSFDSESYTCDSIILLSDFECKVVFVALGLSLSHRRPLPFSWARRVVTGCGPRAVTAVTTKRQQVGRTIYDPREEEHEDVNHRACPRRRGESGQSADPRQLSQQRLHRESLCGPHPRSPAPRDGRGRGQRLSANICHRRG